MEKRELLLARLSGVARVLEADADALALLGLGSTGAEISRLDDWSDLDFFAIVRPGAKARFLDDPSWLDRAHPVAYRFRNTADGFKVLFADGVFAETAVFEPSELAAIPFAGGRLVWAREGFDPSVCEPRALGARLRPPSSVEYVAGELLTCLYVGLCRFRRGELLSAWRFVQSHCVDRVLELAELLFESDPALGDPFNRDRRAEDRYPALEPLFEEALAGYRHTDSAALAILEWVGRYVPVNPALKGAIESLARDGNLPCGENRAPAVGAGPLDGSASGRASASPEPIPPIVPIGTVCSARTEPIDDDWDSVESWIELASDIGEESLAGLEDFSHVEVIYRFHRANPKSIVLGAEHPRENPAWPRVGIFAQRKKARPNLIGATVARVVRVEGRRIYLSGLDAIDGTPVIDIKPVFSQYLPRGDLRQPEWVNGLMERYW